MFRGALLFPFFPSAPPPAPPPTAGSLCSREVRPCRWEPGGGTGRSSDRAHG